MYRPIGRDALLLQAGVGFEQVSEILTPFAIYRRSRDHPQRVERSLGAIAIRVGYEFGLKRSVIELSGDRWDGDSLDVSTTNGGVIMSVPENYSANLQTGTVNGSVNTDFPITVQGRINKQIALNLGSGGATVKAMTTNGGVHLKRSTANE